MSFGFGAFLDGLVGGMERRRRWDQEDLRTQWAREDRELAREDRARRIAIEDEQHNRTREIWRREDEQYAADQELRDSLGDFYTGSTDGSASSQPPSPQGSPAPQPQTQVQGVGDPTVSARSLTVPQPRTRDMPTTPPPMRRPDGTVNDGTPTEVPENTAAEGRANDLPTGRGRQVSTDAPPQGRTAPERPAVPGSTPRTPEVDGSDGPRQSYADALRAAGINDPMMMQGAEAADTARRALAEGINPRTGEPMDPATRQQFEAIIKEADRALAATMAERETGRAVPQPPARQPNPDTTDDARASRSFGRSAAMSGGNEPGAQQARPAPQGGRRIEIPRDPGAPGLNNAPVQSAIAAGETTPRISTGRDGQTPGSTQAPSAPPQPTPAAAPQADTQTFTPQGRAITPPGERLNPDAPPPSVQDVAEPTSPEEGQEAMQGAAQAGAELPSSQAAQESAAATARTITVGNRRLTVEDVNEENLNTAGQNFTRAYNEDAVNRVLEAYARAGRFEEMQQFRDFIQDEETQRAMHHFGRAIFAAGAGDAEQFLTEMAAIYNAPKYYDDGYTVDLEQSEIYRNEDGSFAGAGVAFVNDETGEAHVRQILDEDDFYSIATGLAAPETVFANWMESYQGELERRAEEAAGDEIGERREQFQELWQFLYEQSPEADPLNPRPEDAPPTFREMTPQQQARQVMELMQQQEAAIRGRTVAPSGGGAAAGPVPVATTP